MTRYVVFREGTEPITNTIVSVGSLKPPPDGSTGISFANDDSLNFPIGQAKDFERDETGAISFDIEFDKDFDVREECFSIYANGIVIRNEGEKRIVLEGTIRWIYFVPLPGFPPARSLQKLSGA